MGLFDLGLADSTEVADEKKLCAHIKGLVEESRASASRIAHESIWMTNTAYLLGFDGVTFNISTRQFQPINSTSSYLRKNRLHVNKILPSAQNRCARLCKNPPQYDVRPDGNDNQSKDDARFSLNVLTAQWDKLKLDQKRIPMTMMLQQFGHAYIKVYWDEMTGNFMTNPETGELGWEGEVDADVISPFEIFPDPMAKTFDDVLKSWLIQCKVRKLDYFKNKYPEKGDQVKEESVWLLSSQYEAKINSMNSRGASSNGSHIGQKNCAIEMIKYEAPSLQRPKGRMIVSANGIILKDDELPCGEIPFSKFDDIIIGGKYFSEAIITHARPIQDQYNETIRRRAEWTRKLLAGKYTVPRGSGISQESMNDQSGELLEYDASPNLPDGGRPQALQIPAIPQYAYQETMSLDKEFDNIFGISEVSRGTLPSASIPAIGMQLLTEQDDTRIGVTTESNEHSWARVASLVLKYTQKYWVLPRKLKFAGKTLEYTVKDLKGDDINNTDVICIRGSTVPGSKTLRRQEILNAWQLGLLGAQQDPKVQEKVLGMIEFGDTQDLWADFGLDKAQISRGVKSMESGMPVKSDEGDNHPMWIQEITRYKKSDKWESLTPEIQALFDQCREEHIQWMMKLGNMLPPTPSDVAASTPPPYIPPPSWAKDGGGSSQPPPPQPGEQPPGAA